MSLKINLNQIFLLLCVIILTGCSTATNTVAPDQGPVDSTQQATATEQSAQSATEQATAVPVITPTLEPMALIVNTEGISLIEYEIERSQLAEANDTLKLGLSADQQRQKVIDNLINLTLLAQAAKENGFILDDSTLQNEWDRFTEQTEEKGEFGVWLEKYAYTESVFLVALKRSMAAAWQRDQIASLVPLEAEQVHVRQIIVTDEATAKRALEQVSVPGVSFETYSFRYDLQTGGDLGWFPRGYLLLPEVEEAAFMVEPGKISGVIKSEIGYHIIQVIAREQRPLSTDARRFLQYKAVQDWLEAQRNQSEIAILVP